MVNNFFAFSVAKFQQWELEESRVRRAKVCRRQEETFSRLYRDVWKPRARKRRRTTRSSEARQRRDPSAK